MEERESSILVPPEQSGGHPVNSFRVLRDGDTYLLDLCLFDKEDNCATVVSRSRVTAHFLMTMASALGKAGASDVSSMDVRFQDLRGNI